MATAKKTVTKKSHQKNGIEKTNEKSSKEKARTSRLSWNDGTRHDDSSIRRIVNFSFCPSIDVRGAWITCVFLALRGSGINHACVTNRWCGAVCRSYHGIAHTSAGCCGRWCVWSVSCAGTTVRTVSGACIKGCCHGKHYTEWQSFHGYNFGC